jgi:hypothetical protein
MTDNPATLVSELPCQACDANETVHDSPPYAICRRSPHGDQECTRIFQVERVGQRALQVAALIAKEPDKRLRAEEAAGVCDAYANALYELAAEFDDAGFLAACGVPYHCTKCQVRKPGDGWDIRCGACVEGVAA